MSEYDGPCEAGCVSFHGGEKRHHPDCGYYPSSLTKLHADRIEKLEAKLAKAVEALKHIEHYDIHAPTHARNILKELTGGKDE